MSEKKSRTFEESMNRLETIVSQLEKNELPLEQTIDLFEEGLKLVKECNSQLNAFAGRIEKITKENDQQN